VCSSMTKWSRPIPARSAASAARAAGSGLARWPQTIMMVSVRRRSSSEMEMGQYGIPCGSAPSPGISRPEMSKKRQPTVPATSGLRRWTLSRSSDVKWPVAQRICSSLSTGSAVIRAWVARAHSSATAAMVGAFIRALWTSLDLTITGAGTRQRLPS